MSENQTEEGFRKSLEWICARADQEGHANDPLRLKIVLATIETEARQILAEHPRQHDGPTTTHVLFEGQPLCGFMAGQLPKDWPAGHNWVSIADVVWGDGKAYIPNDSQRLEDPRPCPGCCDRVASSLVLQDAVGGRWR